MSKLKLRALQILVGVVALLVWHVAATTALVGDVKTIQFFFSTPLNVAARIGKIFASGTMKVIACKEPLFSSQIFRINDPCFGGTIWQHLSFTLTETLLAFLIGAAAGIAIGFWFARKPLLAAVFDPYLKMINALPRVVLAPIFMLWLGLGIWSKVLLGVTLVFFIVFFNVYQGVKEVSPTVLANARMLGMNEHQLFRHVYWPSALSWMFSSLHTSVGFALVGAVVGEYLGAAAGLGYLIQEAEGAFDVTGVFAGMAILSAFVLLIDWLVTLAENRLLSWRPQSAAGQV